MLSLGQGQAKVSVSTSRDHCGALEGPTEHTKEGSEHGYTGDLELHRVILAFPGTSPLWEV